MSSIRSRAPVASSPTVRRVMQANVGRETTAERAARRALYAAGLRYREDIRPEPGLRCTADIVFPRQRVCVFIDGCFWHACPEHFAAPKMNSAWWTEKILANVERDARQTSLLRERGWTVVRFWEHEVERADQVVRGVLRACSRSGSLIRRGR
jgi:DNA mismatch endonuclease (patch repair protein)